MKNINWKTIVAPIVATGILEYEMLSHVSVSAHTQDVITTVAIAVVTGVVSLWGHFHNHKK